MFQVSVDKAGDKVTDDLVVAAWSCGVVMGKALFVASAKSDGHDFEVRIGGQGEAPGVEKGASVAQLQAGAG